jgi:hypothetical protein
MFCVHCGAANEQDARTCASCGELLIGAKLPGIEEDAFTRSLLPVGRPAIAIIAGYVGLFAVFIPPLAPVSIAMGLFALRKIDRTPGTYGKGRAWFAIVAGTFWVVAIAALVTIFLLSGHPGRGGR